MKFMREPRAYMKKLQERNSKARVKIIYGSRGKGREMHCEWLRQRRYPFTTL